MTMPAVLTEESVAPVLVCSAWVLLCRTLNASTPDFRAAKSADWGATYSPSDVFPPRSKPHELLHSNLPFTSKAQLTRPGPPTVLFLTTLTIAAYSIDKQLSDREACRFLGANYSAPPPARLKYRSSA